VQENWSISPGEMLAAIETFGVLEKLLMEGIERKLEEKNRGGAVRKSEGYDENGPTDEP